MILCCHGNMLGWTHAHRELCMYSYQHETMKHKHTKIQIYHKYCINNRLWLAWPKRTPRGNVTVKNKHRTRGPGHNTEAPGKRLRVTWALPGHADAKEHAAQNNKKTECMQWKPCLGWHKSEVPTRKQNGRQKLNPKVNEKISIAHQIAKNDICGLT